MAWTACALLLACGLVGTACTAVPTSARPPHPTDGCTGCHAPQAAAWQSSHHARALETLDRSDTPTLLIGWDPMWQAAVRAPDGRWWAGSLAFAPTRWEWIDVLGAQFPGVLLNWNASCAECHVTGWRKRYDAQRDAYASTWHADGVTCTACHAGATTRVGATSCLPCHSRRERLRDEVESGAEPLAQVALLEGADRPGVHELDGKAAEEAFEVGPFLLSRMGGHAGIVCVDCHDPHTLRTRQPSASNALCQRCHASGQRGAPVIADEAAHSHHRPGSQGSRCVACHMPEKVFMGCQIRHDHGFTRPDPALTAQHGVPNACQSCHPGLDALALREATAPGRATTASPVQSRRAAVLAAARDVVPAPAGQEQRWLQALQAEDVPLWRASLLGVAPGPPRAASVRRTLVAARSDPDAWVRAAAVRGLATEPDRVRLLTPLLDDPMRVVRVLAGFALGDAFGTQLPWPPGLRADVEAWLDTQADTPEGALRRAHWAFALRDARGARLHAGHALAWTEVGDPIHREAAALWRAAARTGPDSATAPHAPIAVPGAPGVQ